MKSCKAKKESPRENEDNDEWMECMAHGLESLGYDDTNDVQYWYEILYQNLYEKNK